MSTIVGFGLGFCLGGCFGMLTMAVLLVDNSDGDEDEDED